MSKKLQAEVEYLRECNAVLYTLLRQVERERDEAIRLLEARGGTLSKRTRVTETLTFAV